MSRSNYFILLGIPLLFLALVILQYQAEWKQKERISLAAWEMAQKVSQDTHKPCRPKYKIFGAPRLHPDFDIAWGDVEEVCECLEIQGVESEWTLNPLVYSRLKRCADAAEKCQTKSRSCVECLVEEKPPGER